MNKPAGAETIERLIAEQLDHSDVTGVETYRLHVERYGFAARREQRVDGACGVGYGSAILADAGAGSVLGVDIDAAGVARGFQSGRGERAAPAPALLSLADGSR